ncbi:MAG: hypothetical protein U1A78_35230 [Polyangia bacterium]
MSLGLTRFPSLRRLFERFRRGGGVALGALGSLGSLLWGLGLATRAAASELPPPAEPAPVEELGPPSVLAPAQPAAPPAIRIEPLGATLDVLGTRRVVQLRARWRLRAPAGPLRLQIPSSQSAVAFRLAGRDEPLRPDEVERDDAAPPEPSAAEDVRIDAQSGAVYSREPVPAPGRPPRPRFRHVLSLEVPAAGELELEAALSLSAGFDRRRWRETGFERGHALHLRHDPFVYQFAARGPAGPLQLVTPPGTSAAARADGATSRLLLAAAERRALPLGLTLGLGFAVSDQAAPAGPSADPPVDPGLEPSQRTVWQGLLRASLDLLLPHRDALSLAADVGSDFTGQHHVTAAAVYQLYAPAWPFLPLSAHLDLGGACDLWQSAGRSQGLGDAPSLRCGPRLSLGLAVRSVGLLPSIDVFPQREPDPAAGAAAERWTARYRFALLLTGGL